MPTLNSGIGITGLGKYVPKQQVTTDAIAERLQVTSQSIVQKTGIKSRHYVAQEESASWMSAEAAKEALKNAGVKPEEISLIIGCTTSGDDVFPAMACKVQDSLGARNAGAFDLSASAAAFPIGVSIAADRLRCDESLQHALVVGTAVQSHHINWADSKLSVLLGDGSGAALLSRVPKGYGVLSSEVLSHGQIYDAARLRSGNGSGGSNFIEMDGLVMGREFLKYQPVVIEKALKKAGLKMKDVDMFVFHQANLRLIQFFMDRVKLPMSKTYTNVERFGNTAEASVPMALCEAVQAEKIKRNHIVVLSGVGAGCVLGATVLKWY